ncbi:DUF6527 family protein [Variovorax saccharolyticus]|uniref:DUF6527 family protein n=1 Tax=Variovorax saccharolyticus TaxID=3053516 RepID=UPI00336A0D73
MQFGVLYVSGRTAVHLCACGCGVQIRTPLGTTGWRLVETNDGPTLEPSVCNWASHCRSHYAIRRGVIEWAEPLPEYLVSAALAREADRKEILATPDNPKFVLAIWDSLNKCCSCIN